eukprot:12386082-Alexandrium_andersonii.AAC.1
MVSTAAERSAGVVSDVASLGACPAVDTVPVQFHEVAWEPRTLAWERFPRIMREIHAGLSRCPVRGGRYGHGGGWTERAVAPG